MDKIRSLFSGGSAATTDDHAGHDHSGHDHDHSHDHSHDEPAAAMPAGPADEDAPA
ncbi:MAG TPA: hypothetical protein VM049_05990 [Gaiellaceae bacterium]|nr:hypothetical protein [Gaiellaceae bacterium]